MDVLKVGTRKSPLAMKQTQLVIEQLQQLKPDQRFEIVGLSTKGDREQHADLSKIGGKGVFVKEVEYQLLSGAIDFAVHSLKDMPAVLPPELILAATPKRALPYDCLVFNQSVDLTDTTTPLVIGTSSIRRAKQLGQAFPQFRFVPIRGKIETRLQKMATEQLAGTVLAGAGLERMGYLDQLPHKKLLTETQCIPAVGQGILGVECKKSDQELCAYLAQITDEKTAQAAEAERYFLAQMNGNCDIPLGAFAKKVGDQWEFHAFLATDERADAVHLTGGDVLSLAQTAYQTLHG